jgi:hypothetical protein
MDAHAHGASTLILEDMPTQVTMARITRCLLFASPHRSGAPVPDISDAEDLSGLMPSYAGLSGHGVTVVKTHLIAPGSTGKAPCVAGTRYSAKSRIVHDELDCEGAKPQAPLTIGANYSAAVRLVPQRTLDEVLLSVAKAVLPQRPRRCHRHPKELTLVLRLQLKGSTRAILEGAKETLAGNSLWKRPKLIIAEVVCSSSKIHTALAELMHPGFMAIVCWSRTNGRALLHTRRCLLSEARAGHGDRKGKGKERRRPARASCSAEGPRCGGPKPSPGLRAPQQRRDVLHVAGWRTPRRNR